MNIISKTLEKLTFGAVELVPGDNHRIDAKTFGALAKDTAFQKAVADGVIVLPEGVTVKAPKAPANTTTDAPAGESSKNTDK